MVIARRDLLKTIAAYTAATLSPHGATAAAPALTERPIPSSGERLPVIGMGSSRTFNVGGNTEARARLREVLRLFFEYQDKLIDTSPMYGAAESGQDRYLRLTTSNAKRIADECLLDCTR